MKKIRKLLNRIKFQRVAVLAFALGVAAVVASITIWIAGRPDKNVRAIEQTYYPYISTLPERSRIVVDFYTAGRGAEINAAIGAGKKLYPEIIATLDDAILNAPALDSARVFYRGDSKDHWRIGIDEEVVVPVFVSASLNKRVARRYARAKEGGFVLRINAPIGAQGLYIGATSISKHGDEKEFLFPRDTSFKCIEVVQDHCGAVEVVVGKN
ncbi:MAG: ADP-ribosyltransferase [Alphaproteobacteria bacterium]|nr:ADP-ribosyltransferase [Alphaproteobacteria bacterium]